MGPHNCRFFFLLYQVAKVTPIRDEGVGLLSNMAESSCNEQVCLRKRRCQLTFACAGPGGHTSELPQAKAPMTKFLQADGMGECDSCCRRTTLILCLGTPLGMEREELCPRISHRLSTRHFWGYSTLQRNTFATKHLPSHMYSSTFSLFNLLVAFSFPGWY